MKAKETEVRKRIWEYAGVFLILGMLCAFVVTMFGKTSSTWKDELQPMSTGWYIMRDGQRQEIELPITLDVAGDLLLYYDLGEEYAGQTVTFKGASYEPQIRLGNQVLYQYTDGAFPANEPMKAKMNCDAVIPASYRGGEVVSLQLHNEEGIYELPVICAGTGTAVMQSHMREITVMILIALVMVVLASVAVGVSLYLYRIKLRDHRFLDAAAFLVICATWCVTDSAVIQQYSGYTPVVRMISFYAFMLLAVPMLHFVRNSGEMKKYRILDACIGAFYLNAIVQGVLCYLGVFTMIEMLFVTHLLLIVGVSVIAVLLVKEYRNNPCVELKIIWHAFMMLAGSGVLALLLYWLFEIPYYELLFEAGILVFVITLLFGLVITMTEHIQYKTEMLVYQRLAKEDNLTGIANRLAFEEKVSEIQSRAETYRDVALIFMDVNGLKKVNDRFGHNAGDELIVAAARCIENAFSRLGSCYRIGGDEFCVLIVEPQETPEEWFKVLDQEILKYNTTGKRKLSIARGMSYLRDEKGCLKRFSDWKYEADQNMYLDKGMEKR